MNKAYLFLLLVFILSCANKPNHKPKYQYKIYDSNAHSYFAESFTIDERNCLVFRGERMGVGDEEYDLITMCGNYTILKINNTHKNY